MFFSRVNFLCWLLFLYPFHPRVTAVARKRPRSFCQKCRWQVTAKHTCILPMWLWMKWHCELVYGWMVYTELVPKRQQFHIAQAMQQLNIAVSTPSRWILKIRAIKRIVTHSESHATWALSVCSRAENSALWKRSIMTENGEQFIHSLMRKITLSADCSPLSSFKTKLKSFLFSQYFHPN